MSCVYCGIINLSAKYFKFVNAVKTELGIICYVFVKVLKSHIPIIISQNDMKKNNYRRFRTIITKLIIWKSHPLKILLFIISIKQNTPLENVLLDNVCSFKIFFEKLEKSRF